MIERHSPPLGLIEKLGVLTIVLSSIEVLDLSGGRTSFVITPFLIISPIYIVFGVAKLLIMRKSDRKSVFVPTTVLLSLICFIILSIVLLENDPLFLAPQRALLTIWMIIFSLYFVFINLKNLNLIIYHAAKAFIWLNFAFYVLEFTLNRNFINLPIILEEYFSFSSISVNEIPRLYGIIADPNRSSTTTVLLMALVYLFEINCKKSVPTFSAGLMIVGLSVSRTSIACLLIFLFFVLIRQKFFQSFNLFVICLITFSVAVVYVSQQDFGEEIYKAFVSSPDRQGSTDIHLSLLGEGVELGFSNLKRFLIGTGWGTEYFYAADFFDGDRYANFHSGYISFFTQTGVFGLFLYVLVIVLPAVRNKKYLTLVAILLWSNIFYQYSTQFSYWFFVISPSFSTYLNSFSSENKKQRGKIFRKHPEKQYRFNLRRKRFN